MCVTREEMEAGDLKGWRRGGKIHVTETQGLLQRRKRTTTEGRGRWRRALEQGGKQDTHAYILIHTQRKHTAISQPYVLNTFPAYRILEESKASSNGLQSTITSASYIKKHELYLEFINIT